MYPVLHADPEAAAAAEVRLGPLRGGQCPALSGRSAEPSIPSFPHCSQKNMENRSFWHRGPRVTPVCENQWEDGTGAAPRPPHPAPLPTPPRVPPGAAERTQPAPCPGPGWAGSENPKQA